jgi:putative mRNA 3-end processing factor
MTRLLEFTDRGIYCPRADCYIDPKRTVERAIITHAHSDHARRGNKQYLAHRLTVPVLRHRLGKKISVQSVEYGEPIDINHVRFSLHPAGHVIGSAQVRVAYRDEVWIVTGDYKLDHDPLAGVYEPIPCTVFCTESTFGLPVYKWGDSAAVIADINEWWKRNRENDVASVLFGYSLGKSQRLLHAVDVSIGDVYVHPAIERINELFRHEGYPIPEVFTLSEDTPAEELQGSLVMIPPNTMKNGWLDHVPECSTAHASGWMAAQGASWMRNADAGFVISDHADWTGLNEAVRLSGAETIYVTHGFTGQFARWLCEEGYDARSVDDL